MVSERIKNLQERVAVARAGRLSDEQLRREEDERMRSQAEGERLQNIQRLEETGVPSFFREIQEAEILGAKHKVDVLFDERGRRVDLRWVTGYTPPTDRGDVFGDTSYSSIRVSLDERDRLLVDSGRLKEGQDVISVVEEKVFQHASRPVFRRGS